MYVSLLPTTILLLVFSVHSADHAAMGGGEIIPFIITKTLDSNRELNRYTCLPEHVSNYHDIITTHALAKLLYGREKTRTHTISSYKHIHSFFRKSPYRHKIVYCPTKRFKHTTTAIM